VATTGMRCCDSEAAWRGLCMGWQRQQGGKDWCRQTISSMLLQQATGYVHPCMRETHALQHATQCCSQRPVLCVPAVQMLGFKLINDGRADASSKASPGFYIVAAQLIKARKLCGVGHHTVKDGGHAEACSVCCCDVIPRCLCA
jgi:hypothetical protein